MWKYEETRNFGFFPRPKKCLPETPGQNGEQGVKSVKSIVGTWVWGRGALKQKKSVKHLSNKSINFFLAQKNECIEIIRFFI